jgi:hypothetical protein
MKEFLESEIRNANERLHFLRSAAAMPRYCGIDPMYYDEDEYIEEIPDEATGLIKQQVKDWYRTHSQYFATSDTAKVENWIQRISLQGVTSVVKCGIIEVDDTHDQVTEIISSLAKACTIGNVDHISNDDSGCVTYVNGREAAAVSLHNKKLAVLCLWCHKSRYIFDLFLTEPGPIRWDISQALHVMNVMGRLLEVEGEKNRSYTVRVPSYLSSDHWECVFAKIVSAHGGSSFVRYSQNELNMIRERILLEENENLFEDEDILWNIEHNTMFKIMPRAKLTPIQIPALRRLTGQWIVVLIRKFSHIEIDSDSDDDEWPYYYEVVDRVEYKFRVVTQSPVRLAPTSGGG